MTGDPPPPCSNFSVTAVSETRALMFGGYQHEGIRLRDVYIVEFGKESVVSLFSFCYLYKKIVLNFSFKFLSCGNLFFFSSFGPKYPFLPIQLYLGLLELVITR